MRFVRSSGPGGQNVNKVATCAQLRFDAARSPALTPAMLARLRRLAGRRMTKDGVVVIEARQFRTQERNREDAEARLVALLQRAAIAPTTRRPTRPSAGQRRHRLEQKKHRAGIKAGRRPVSEDR